MYPVQLEMLERRFMESGQTKGIASTIGCFIAYNVTTARASCIGQCWRIHLVMSENGRANRFCTGIVMKQLRATRVMRHRRVAPSMAESYGVRNSVMLPRKPTIATTPNPTRHLDVDSYSQKRICSPTQTLNLVKERTCFHWKRNFWTED